MGSTEGGVLRKGNFIWGRFSSFALMVAALVFAVDQAHKHWMVHVFRIKEREPYTVTSYLDLVYVENRGISYGLFQQDGETGRAVLIAISVAAAALLLVWVAHMAYRWTALSASLIAGGALGNALDRYLHGGVLDFFRFHYGSFEWYVFNIADVAIVAGVIGLVAESLFAGHKNVAKHQ
jgi:signal peptidase II